MRIRKSPKDAGLFFCLGMGRLFKPRGIPILGYHSIDNNDLNISTPPEMFAFQMGFLKSAGIRVISLKQLMSVVYSEKEIPGKVLVLTFDDGLKDFYKSAWPILCRYGFSATVFVPTDFIGEKSWWYNDYGLTPLPMLDWQELRELSKSGIDIQSHWCSHRKLTDLALSDTQKEVRESKKILEQGLGKSVDFICCPQGDVDESVIEAIKASGYKGAICGEDGIYKVGDNPYMIKRQLLDYISITDERTALLSIKCCLQGTFAWYVRTKRRLKNRWPIKH